VFLTPNQVPHMNRRVFITPNYRRILEAKRLLLHSELTIAEIGYELGFEDPSYFSRFIRWELKTTPAELRGLIRQKYQKFMR
jgi:AraC-like DNA-binding protein